MVPRYTYLQITHQYASYVKKKYGIACVVFDGYETGPSTKDHEHIRRTGNSSANVHVESSTEVHQNQNAFLKNDHKKKQLIAILSHHLQFLKTFFLDCFKLKTGCRFIFRLFKSNQKSFISTQNLHTNYTYSINRAQYTHHTRRRHSRECHQPTRTRLRTCPKISPPHQQLFRARY